MKLRNIYWIVCISAIMLSCGSDDDGGLPDVEVVPPRDLADVVDVDDADIVAFLKSHFYNYEEFQTPTADFDYRIRFDTIAGENADKVSIFDSGDLAGVEFGVETITVGSDEFQRTDGEVVDHKLYYLIARQGTSDTLPTIGDNYILRYEGSLLDGTVFDSSVSQPVQFNLSQVVRGFGNGMRFFNSGTEAVENGDGTFSYDGYGIGAIFMPSGLGYFSIPSSNLIPAYAPLIFKVDAYYFQENTDTDGDGIPSYMEDLDGNGNLNNDNTDVADEVRVLLPNYRDSDDDNDGIPTIEEINLKPDGTFLSYRDTDGDGIFDHLDID